MGKFMFMNSKAIIIEVDKNSKINLFLLSFDIISLFLLSLYSIQCIDDF